MHGSDIQVPMLYLPPQFKTPALTSIPSRVQPDMILSGQPYVLDLSDDRHFRWSAQVVRQAGIATDWLKERVSR